MQQQSLVVLKITVTVTELINNFKKLILYPQAAKQNSQNSTEQNDLMTTKKTNSKKDNTSTMC